MKVKVFLTVFLSLVIGNSSVKLPPSIPVCRRDVPNISSCILNSIKVLQPRLSSGNLGNGLQLPGLEPFFIKELGFGNEATLKVLLTNIQIKGASNFHVEKFKVNIRDYTFDGIAKLPRLDIYGKYKMVLNFLGAKTRSEGDYFTAFEDARIRGKINGKIILKNGVEYLRFDPISVKFDRGKVADLKLTNLFGGNKILGEVTINLLKNNPDFVLDGIYPQVEGALSKIFTGVANKIVENSSLEELLPLH